MQALVEEAPENGAAELARRRVVIIWPTGCRRGKHRIGSEALQWWAPVSLILLFTGVKAALRMEVPIFKFSIRLYMQKWNPFL